MSGYYKRQRYTERLKFVCVDVSGGVSDIYRVCSKMDINKDYIHNPFESVSPTRFENAPCGTDNFCAIYNLYK